MSLGSHKYKFKVKIAYRMALALGLIILYWLATVAYAAYQQNTLHASLRLYDTEIASPPRALHWVLDSLRSLQSHLTQHVMADTPEEMANAESLLNQDRSRLEASLRGYHDSDVGGEDHADYDRILAEVQAFQQTVEQVLTLSRNHANPAQHETAVKLLLGDSRQALDALNDTAATWTTRNEALAHERLTSNDARYQHGMKMLLTFCLLALLSNIWAAMSLASAITQPLRQAIELAKAVAGGDLTRRLEAYGENEMAQLFIALNDMTAQLAGLIADMLHSARAVDLAAAELAHSNEDLSQRTQEQAGRLQETTASMQQITSLGRSNSDNAGHADRLALQTREMAEAGGSVVAQAVSAMGGIKDASAKIASIISVIDEIAFQTNLLALNAAVEAARAGEQGRGFAVVASEVRALAQRSADAAKQIKGLIRDSADKVSTGTELVDRSGQTLSQILESVREMTTLIRGIADSSREQSERMLRINESIVQLDGATQQNASLVEEGSAVNHSLREQSDALSRRASSFRVEQQLSDNGAPVAPLGSAAASTASGASVTHLPKLARALARRA